ncbi:hypothetical protein D3869_25730 (plasmid) [Azospirillum brasilense]|uniref:HTH cro/C1-type domain-containing protein n=1 Tax=Azospirillum brasilense TaxID=192 RepID=A0A4D8R6C4_AZOBR|nr:hypothetical protein [Azospirillum brasilense]QCO18618.1 hypothetical protein D3869_25730 [Azospirillum brasilense]
MPVHEWPQIVRALRRLHGLTAAQFAVMLATTEETVARWESGAVLPDPREQALLRDVLTGHFRHHPTFLGLKAMVRSMNEKCTLYTPGLIAQAVSPPLARWIERHRFDIVGSSLLPRIDGLTAEMMERYALPMLEGTSDVLSVTYNDRAVAFRNAVINRRLNVVPVDGVRVLVLVDRVLYLDDGRDTPDPDVHMLTADQLVDD